MDPLVILISIATLLAFVLVFAGLRGKSDGSSPMAERLDAFRGDESARLVPQEKRTNRLKEQRSYSGLPILSGFIGQFKGSEAMAVHLERAGLPLRVGELYMIRWGMAAVFFGAPLIFGVAIFNLLIGTGLAVVGYMLPAMWVNGKKKKRTERINAQLVDLLGLVGNSLKSGYGLMQSF